MKKIRLGQIKPGTIDDFQLEENGKIYLLIKHNEKKSEWVEFKTKTKSIRKFLQDNKELLTLDCRIEYLIS